MMEWFDLEKKAGNPWTYRTILVAFTTKHYIGYALNSSKKHRSAIRQTREHLMGDIEHDPGDDTEFGESISGSDPLKFWEEKQRELGLSVVALKSFKLAREAVSALLMVLDGLDDPPSQKMFILIEG